MSLYERGWRDGFYGREAREADTTYVQGWLVGLRDGDRTRPVAVLAPAAELDGDTESAAGCIREEES